MPLDLFGVQVSEEIIRHLPAGLPRFYAYAGTPGKGPPTETCRTCKHFVRLEYSKTYFKCGLRHKVWTRGPGTDIKAKSPACEHWTMPDPVQWIRER